MNSRSIILMIAMLSVLGFGYEFFFISNNSLASAQQQQTVGADLLKLSSDLSKVTLSQDLFSKPSYLYLVDFSTPIPQNPIGRNNPFDILGR